MPLSVPARCWGGAGRDGVAATAAGAAAGGDGGLHAGQAAEGLPARLPLRHHHVRRPCAQRGGPIIESTRSSAAPEHVLSSQAQRVSWCHVPATCGHPYATTAAVCLDMRGCAWHRTGAAAATAAEGRASSTSTSGRSAVAVLLAGAEGAGGSHDWMEILSVRARAPAQLTRTPRSTDTRARVAQLTHTRCARPMCSGVLWWRRQAAARPVRHLVRLAGDSAAPAARDHGGAAGGGGR
eukprot:COSAG01_NODE_2109_length_8408_cov_33.352870_12_plen_238_part_00